MRWQVRDRVDDSVGRDDIRRVSRDSTCHVLWCLNNGIDSGIEEARALIHCVHRRLHWARALIHLVHR